MIKKVEVLLALGMVILVLILPEKAQWIVAGWVLTSIALLAVWKCRKILARIAPWFCLLYLFLCFVFMSIDLPEYRKWFVGSAVVGVVLAVGFSLLAPLPPGEHETNEIADWRIFVPGYLSLCVAYALSGVLLFLFEPETRRWVAIAALGMVVELIILSLFPDPTKQEENRITPPQKAKEKIKPCPNCGFQNQSDAIWCEYCGQSLGLFPPFVQRAWKVVVLVLVALVVGFLCARFFLGRKIEPVSHTPVGTKRAVQSLADAKFQTTPTATPRPTVTPTPTVNPNQQPPPGTVLYAGQGVTKGALSLKIGELETVDEGYTRDTFFSTTVPYFGFFFYATNHGRERLLLRYDPAAVHISDDVGTVYTHQALDVEQYWIEPGATKEFGPRWEEAYMCKHQGNIIDGCLMGRNSLFRGPINPRAKSLFITIDYLEDMNSITWRYDLVPTR